MNDSNRNTLKLHNPKSHAPAVYIPCWLLQVPSSLLSTNAKMLYGRLSQWCNETGIVYRSIPQLSKELGTPERTIERHLKELKEANLIGTYHPQAGGLNHYEFYDHPWMHEPITGELVYKQDDGSYPQDPPPKMAVPPAKNGGHKYKQIKNNKNNNNNAHTREEKKPTKKQKELDTFESFWEAYPSKKAKKKAFEIWKRKQLWCLADEIIEKVKNQSENEKQWREGYIPNPTTYLNQERWQDEITPSEPVYKQRQRQENKERMEALEKTSIEKSKTEYKKGTFQKIINLANQSDSKNPPPTKQLNDLLKAAGVTRGKKDD